MTSIEDNAFAKCENLVGITFPEGLTEIGSYAFEGCSSLLSVRLPASLTQLNHDAFQNCSSLREIVVAEGNAAYSSADGVLFNKDKSELLVFPLGRQRTIYTVPSSVTVIGENAFYSCSELLGVTLPAGLLTIESYAFYGCSSLDEIVLPASLTSIEFGAFQGCSGLDSAVFENASGWKTSSGTEIPQSDLSDVSLAVKCLTETYCYEYWRCEA